MNWKPDIAGNYTIYAVFAGTNGYWPSSAETSFAVDQTAAASPTATQAPANLANTNNAIFAGVAAIIVVIIVVGAATILMLRRKP